jgi:hypothetical protein
MNSHYLSIALEELLQATISKLHFGWKFISLALVFFVFAKYVIPFIKNEYLLFSRAYVRTINECQIKFEREVTDRGFKWLANRVTRPIRKPIFFVKRFVVNFKRIKTVFCRRQRYKSYLQSKRANSSRLLDNYLYYGLLIIFSILTYVGLSNNFTFREHLRSQFTKVLTDQ